ncbi:MAG: hypothetical protein K0U72_02825 [Gammaproteobacteria bacterium]|nr:hypothetical protein [Gammaproteobacteria bacterium]
MATDAIEFSSDGGKVRISWNFDGDYLVAIESKAYGFRGHADGHVVLDEFKKFAVDVVALAKSRKGQANFSSAFAGFFDVTVRSTDNVGHLGVFGSLIGKSGTNLDEDQMLQFSLHFEPSQIEDAARALSRLAS